MANINGTDRAARRPRPAHLTRRRFVGLAAGAAAASLVAGCSGGADDEGSAGADDAAQADDADSDADSGGEEESNSIVLFLFDTVIQISAACSTDVLDAISERLEYFENTFSRTIEGSDVWNINEAGGEPVEVAEETAEVIERALEISELTGGVFDITIGCVSTLWDFVEGVKPDDAEIQAALPHIGYEVVSVDGTTVTLSDPETKIDLGGIAKGYIADDIAAMFLDYGVEDACISLGGNVYVLGKSYDGDAWNVGVQDPNGYYDDAIASIEMGDASLVTSGLYERCFEEDGVTYYHILDPKTGYPVETDLMSASILCEESCAADAYATVLFLLGHDAAMELLEADERFEGLLIDSDLNISTTSGADFTLLVDEE